MMTFVSTQTSWTGVRGFQSLYDSISQRQMKIQTQAAAADYAINLEYSSCHLESPDNILDLYFHILSKRSL